MNNLARSLATGLVAAGAVLSFAVASASASPVLFCKDGPGIDLVGDGCVSGEARPYPNGGDGIYDNAGGGDPEAAVELAIFQATGVAVDIGLYGASDSDASLFSFLPVDPATSQSGSFSVLDGTLISYITVKAANSFALYQLAPPASTGTYTTAGILNNGGQQPDVSHIRFWTVASVPEPMTGGLVLLGSALAFRRRRARS